MTERRPRRPKDQVRATMQVLQPVSFRAGARLGRWSEDTSPHNPAPHPTQRGACLVVLSGPDEGALYKLRPDSTVFIGRGPNCDVRINDDGVSRTHARIVVRRDDVILEDLGSRNGTYVGDDRVQTRPLANDDLLRVGATTIIKYCTIDTLEEEFRERLLAAALKDSLTGTYNRRHFEERLASECAAARRHKRPLSLLMIDIDDFKAVNDTHGHPVGDAVLYGVAQTLKQGVRQEDLIFRYGGEELAILLRETDVKGAVRLAERLRKDVAKSPYGRRDGAGPDLQVSISIGVTAFDPKMTEADLVEKADAALYQAKGKGKNCVVKG